MRRTMIGLSAMAAGLGLAGCALYEFAAAPNENAKGAEPCLVDKVTDAEHAKRMTSPVYRQAYDRYTANLDSRPKRLQVAVDSANPDGPKKWVSNPPPVGCFAPGTSPEVVEAFMRAMQSAEDGAWPSNSEAEYQIATRWSHSGSTGDPITIYWSLVPDGTAWDGAASNLFLQMDIKFLFSGGRARWVGLLQDSFDRWEQLTGIDFVRVRFNGNDWDDGAAFGNGYSANLRGHIRIGMNSIDGGSNVLAYNYYPQNGDMKLDVAENWADPADSWRFMRNIVTHELGHAIGIAHVCSSNSNQLMEPYLDTSFDGPQHDDARGAQRNYGDAFEPNNASNQAINIGDVTPNIFGFNIGVFGSDSTSQVYRTAISVNGDEDWYRFSTTKASVANWTLAPVGLVYDNSSQNSNGSCNSGNNINSLTQANMDLAIYDSNLNLITQANTNGPGVNEIVSPVINPGTYYLRVSENNSPSQAQMYGLTWQLTTTNGFPVITQVANQTVNEQAAFSVDVNASDPEGNAITYSLNGAPTGMTINAATGVINWTPAEDQGPNNYTVTVRALDNGSPARQSFMAFQIAVNEVNVAPILNNPGAQSVDEKKLLTVSLNYSDSDIPKNNLTFQLLSAPAGMTIDNQGKISWTPTEAQGPNVYSIQVRLNDNGTPNLSDTETFQVTVREINEAPVLAAIGNKSVNEESLLTFTASATDPDLPANTLTFSLIGAPAGAGINPSKGVFNWTPTEAQGPGSYTFVVRVTDDRTPALVDQETITVTVNEVTKRIAGKINLEDWSVSPAGIVARIAIHASGNPNPAEVYYPVLGADGSYSFSMAGVLPAGTYDVYAKCSHWLQRKIGPLVIAGTGNAAVNFTLINGDVDGDNAVTVFDYAELSDAFDSVPGSPNWNPNADLDGDDAVTVFDYAILSQNFDKEGD